MRTAPRSEGTESGSSPAAYPFLARRSPVGTQPPPRISRIPWAGWPGRSRRSRRPDPRPAARTRRRPRTTPARRRPAPRRPAWRGCRTWTSCAAAVARPLLPLPGMPGHAGRPPPPPRASCFIIFCASVNRSSSPLTSDTVTPEPLAMRSRREPLICLEWVRSNGVIDRTIASMRSNSRSSRLSSWSRIAPCPASSRASTSASPSS